MSAPMTAKAGLVLETIVRYSLEHAGRAPTNREIGKLTGISSTSVVNYHLGKLEELGLIRRDAIVGRGIEVIGGVWTPPPHLAHLAVGVAAAA